MSSKLIYLALFITIAASHPLPQRLTEQEFRAFKTDALNPDNNVDIFGGYAKVCLFCCFFSTQIVVFFNANSIKFWLKVPEKK